MKSRQNGHSEAEFLKNLLCDLSLLNKSIPLISMHCDSQVVISKVTSKNFNEKKTLKSER